MSVISELLKVFPFIDVTVIEPCRESIDAYKTLTDEQKLEFKGVSWNWCQETFQTFSQKNSDRFDFICAIHALYFSPLSELKKQLLTLHEMLDDGGIIFSLHDKGEGYCFFGGAWNGLSVFVNSLYRAYQYTITAGALTWGTFCRLMGACELFFSKNFRLKKFLVTTLFSPSSPLPPLLSLP